MSYLRFLAYDVVGGILWVGVCLFAGYFFGNLPFVKKNFSLVILAIVLVSVMPAVVEYLRHRAGMRAGRSLSPMEPLKIGITGVRGVVGQTLTPELVVRFAEAFGSYLDGGRVLVCRDPRPSGPMVQAAVTAGLLAVGCEVVDLGVCPTPTLQLAVPWLGADGGISITGGHNPPEWNALKFVRDDGLYLSAIQGEELLDVYHQGAVARGGWDRIATRVEEQDAVPHHLEALAARFDVAAVRARRLRVAVDCGNGSCARFVPRWLADLGCEVLPINDDPSLPFPRLPEPSIATAALGSGGRAGGRRRPRPRARRRRRAAEPRRRDGPAALRGADPAPRGRGRARPAPGPGRDQRLDDRARRPGRGPARGARSCARRSARRSSPRRSSSTAPSSAARATAAWRCRASRRPTTARPRPASCSSTSRARAGRCPRSWPRLPAVAVRKLALAVAPSLLFSVLQEFRDAVGEVAGRDGGPDGRREDRVARRLGARAGVEHPVAGPRDRRGGRRGAGPGARGLGARAPAGLRRHARHPHAEDQHLGRARRRRRLAHARSWWRASPRPSAPTSAAGAS